MATFVRPDASYNGMLFRCSPLLVQSRQGWMNLHALTQRKRGTIFECVAGPRGRRTTRRTRRFPKWWDADLRANRTPRALHFPLVSDATCTMSKVSSRSKTSRPSPAAAEQFQTYVCARAAPLGAPAPARRRLSGAVQRVALCPRALTNRAILCPQNVPVDDLDVVVAPRHDADDAAPERAQCVHVFPRRARRLCRQARLPHDQLGRLPPAPAAVLLQRGHQRRGAQVWQGHGLALSRCAPSARPRRFFTPGRQHA